MHGIPLHPLDHEPKLWIKTGMQAKVFHAITAEQNVQSY